MDQHKSCIIFCNEDITHGCRTFIDNSCCHIGDRKNESSDSASHCDPNNNNCEDGQSEMDNRDNNSRASSGKNRNVTIRKSVSFDDDVMVYLFDQERPTLELHSKPCMSLPGSNSCSHQDVTLEDGLEWEDDFSALEKNSDAQCVRHCTFSLPTQSCTSLPRPERFSLPPTCLFLTHVTESDLEL